MFRGLSLGEIEANVIENPVDDDAKDDLVHLEPITRKVSCIVPTTLHNFLL